MLIAKVINRAVLISFVISFLFLVLNNLIFGSIRYFFFSGLGRNPIINENIYFKIIVGCILAPIFETYLFQVLPNSILVKLNVKSNWLLIVLPSLIFGLNHYYDVLYIIAAFFMGVILNLFYLFTKDNYKYSIVALVLLHSMYNIFSLIIL